MTKTIRRIECFPIIRHILMLKIDIGHGSDEYICFEAIIHNPFDNLELTFYFIKADS